MADAAAGDGIFEELANAAVLECYFASCFPPSLGMARLIPLGVGGPCGVSEASDGWQQGAEGLQQLQEELRRLTEQLPETAWAGDDRDGFDTEISNLLAQLGNSHNTAEAVSITLKVLPPLFAMWPPMALLMGTGMAVIAASFYAAALSGIGDVTGVSESIYSMGVGFGEGCLSVLTVSNEVLIDILIVVQGVFAAIVGTDIQTQQEHGNTAIAGDLGQAEVDGLGEVTTNVAQFALTKVLDKGADKLGGETPETPAVLSGPMGALVRGEGRLARVGAHAASTQADVAQHQAADRTGAGEKLQDAINGLLDREGPSVELE